MSAVRLGAAFLGHGTPMNALDQNRYTQTWQAVGKSFPRPRAILMVSAHWYVNATAVTAMPRPKTIHDFYGFPQALFDIQYPAPGLPSLYEEIAEIVKPEAIGADHDSWGLDHGAWSVLLHAYPAADVPVVQLSLNALKPAQYHFDMGARLSALSSQGVLVIGSGNIVHNLRAMDRDHPDAAFPWARAFNEDALAVLTSRPEDAPGLVTLPGYAQAAPTPEHFLPVLYLAGHLAAIGVKPGVLVDGYAYGSLSMTSLGVEVPCPPASADLPGASPLGTSVPGEQSNI
ncbi:4,5-DOPA dioxygenase extradiol [Pseudoxanthomonas gei]|uniref:4,5-DOPA dioxygenase extradiol n=1 Tax=Pseudoxanthomonas gei TaxID=1383030 RepID=A0ABX0AFC6_9GAMM|nr:4,5-DOPA dioxygenase extradiol [Pseudoxanthomonas gei]NDK38186.1 4,5-DOPA dioxygenase extradiol [Pseudoxanthomonas gei]